MTEALRILIGPDDGPVHTGAEYSGLSMKLHCQFEYYKKKAKNLQHEQ